jgi:hypothetical protein
MDRTLVTREEIGDVLRRWGAGSIDPPGVKRWLAEAGGVAAGQTLDAGAREALAALDLLEVHLLTAEDVPALRALLDGGDERAVERWVRYRDGIDLTARSRALRKSPFYRAFCR